MIPVSLEFSGLNSYRQQQSIDFSDLMSQGLFGIFGVTGAGKSTVLDAMTLALFGQVKRAPRQTQGIINAREKRCRVRFVFELSGHSYAAERVFERGKGDAYSCSIKSCRLVEDDSLVLADKSKVMDDEIEKLLNMNCERFCQTVVLPQGQFDQLLHMKPSDRSRMLEELFNYGDYGESLVRRCWEKLREADAEVARLNENLSMLEPCGPEDLKRLRHDLDEATEKEAALKAQLAAAENERRRQEALAGQEQERRRCLQELALLEARAEEIADLLREEEAARKAEPLRHALDEAVTLNSQTLSARQEAETAQRRQQEAASALSQADENLQALRESLQESKSRVEPRLRDLELAVHEREAADSVRRQWQVAERELAKSGLAAAADKLEREIGQVRQAQTLCADELKSLRRDEKEAFAAWEQAVEEEKAAQRQNAAALLAEGLREGEPCPVCGSIHHQPLAHHASDLAAVSARAKQTREAWQQLQRQAEEKEKTGQELAEKEKSLASSRQRTLDEFNRGRSQSESLERAVSEKDALWRELARCDDPKAEHARLSNLLAQATEQEKSAASAREEAARLLNDAALALEKARAAFAERDSRLNELKRQLLQAVEEAGFSSAQEAKSALRSNEKRQEIASAVKAYDEKLLRQQLDYGRLNEALRGFEPDAVEPARRRAEALAEEQRELLSRDGRLKRDLEKAEQDAVRAAELKERQGRALSRAEVLRRLAALLKGNAFVRYLARGTMLELAHESSDILLALTAGRYRLELTEDGSSDFILVDNNGGVRRQISGLSGGETFLVSLAMALALSGKIQMHAAPLGFFFLDEGFGSLDGASLEAAMAVLEKLPSDKRAVGLITHVREVRERVPRYLEVIADPVHGSRIELRKN
ncbi:MAG: SMC family ATPase [Firmicutes bacterium]|nr:SMC family ATPase [Bacillota bacterium]